MVRQDTRSGEVGVVLGLILDTCGKKCCVGVTQNVCVVAVRAEGSVNIQDVRDFDGF